MCPLALGTQTIGSVIRPAAFSGVVGYKPSYGRIALDGVIPLDPSVDHVGLFIQDVEGMALTAAICVEDWEPASSDTWELTDSDTRESAGHGIREHGDSAPLPSTDDRPVLGVPDDEYLSQASEAGLDCFEAHVEALRDAGFGVRRVTAFDDVDAVNERHEDLVAAEAALAHHEWFRTYPDQYSDSTVELVREGRAVSVETLADARRSRHRLRASLAETMAEH